MKKLLMDIYNKLLDRYSYQHWWPAQTKDEMVIGAILTQNTSWSNVEKAINNLKKHQLCSLEKIYSINDNIIKQLIIPAGFFNQKAQYLKNIARFFIDNGSFLTLSTLDTAQLRNKLLSIKGIGKETADSILLYAFDRAVFVIDAYTKRLINRHNISAESDYDEIQNIFMDNLDNNHRLFGEYHALIVKNAKEFCKSKPLCDNCPIKGL